jgi:hypothetical protein
VPANYCLRLSKPPAQLKLSPLRADTNPMARYLIIDGGMASGFLTHALAGADSATYACGEGRQMCAHSVDGPTRSWPTCQECRDALGLQTATDRAEAAGRIAYISGAPRSSCPYADLRTERNRVTFARALRNSWHRAFDAASRELVEPG